MQTQYIRGSLVQVQVETWFFIIPVALAKKTNDTGILVDMYICIVIFSSCCNLSLYYRGVFLWNLIYFFLFLWAAADSMFRGEFIHSQHTRHEGLAHDSGHAP